MPITTCQIFVSTLELVTVEMHVDPAALDAMALSTVIGKLTQ